jgi:hypothetical protein
MSKHTPGPFFTSCPHGGTIYVEARLRGSTIQEVCSVGPTENPGQQEYNAQLFAKAPQLLLALIDAHAILKGVAGELPSLKERLTAYENLIASAGGGE